MGFQEVQDLSCDITVSLGGVNKKTGKTNPTKIEGYYLGKREVEDRKKKSGVSYIYAFKTPKGSIGVWGKTDLDRKMTAVTPGAMVRVTQSGMTPTPNGDMYKFKVEVDKDNTIEVLSENLGTSNDDSSDDSSEALFGAGAEEAQDALGSEEDDLTDEVTPSRAAAPKAVAKAPDAARAAKVQALLNGARSKSTA